MSPLRRRPLPEIIARMRAEAGCRLERDPAVASALLDWANLLEDTMTFDTLPAYRGVPLAQETAAPEVTGSLIPEPFYNSHAATAATRADDLIRVAAEENDAADQIVQLMEEAAQQLAAAGMTLRVCSRHLYRRNVPGADRYRLAELAQKWEMSASAHVRACAAELRNTMGLTDDDED